MTPPRCALLCLLSAACATTPRPAAAPLAAQPLAPTAVAAAPSPAEPQAAPAGMQWARNPRFTLLVPDEAEEVSAGHWRVGPSDSAGPYSLGVTVMPFSRDVDAFLREQLGNPALAARVLDGATEAPRGGRAWRRWHVEIPGGESTLMTRARYLVSGNRTVFAICARLDQSPAQEAVCDQILGSMRAGPRAAESTDDPALTTIAVDDGAIDVPSTWRRLPGPMGAIVPTDRAPAEHAEMAAFLAQNPNTSDLNMVIEGTIDGARGQANTTVDVRERRVGGRGARAEGTLRYRSTTTRDARAAVGRALVHAGNGSMVLCTAPAGPAAEACERSVESFEPTGR